MLCPNSHYLDNSIFLNHRYGCVLDDDGDDGNDDGYLDQLVMMTMVTAMVTKRRQVRRPRKEMTRPPAIRARLPLILPTCETCANFLCCDNISDNHISINIHHHCQSLFVTISKVLFSLSAFRVLPSDEGAQTCLRCETTQTWNNINQNVLHFEESVASTHFSNRDLRVVNERG